MAIRGSAITPAERQVERDERAAILEFDGGLSREEADRLALEMVPDAPEEQP